MGNLPGVLPQRSAAAQTLPARLWVPSLLQNAPWPLSPLGTEEGSPLGLLKRCHRALQQQPYGENGTGTSVRSWNVGA